MTVLERSRMVRDGHSSYIAGYKHGSVVGKFRERYASVCPSCFDTVELCAHYPEVPLRLIFVGHNPSDHAFASGYMYSNPLNHMWSLLNGTYAAAALDGDYVGVVDKSWPIVAQDWMALHRGLGLSDLGVEPGNEANAYSPQVLRQWRDELFAQLKGHSRRAGETLKLLQDYVRKASAASHSAADGGSGGVTGGHPRKVLNKAADSDQIGASSSSSGSSSSGTSSSDASSCEECAQGWLQLLSCDQATRILHWVADSASLHLTDEQLATANLSSIELCAPKIVAFTGKSQWKCLFEPPLTKCETGIQPKNLRPPGWPYPPSTDVFVLVSSSGRAAFTHAQRREPYKQLGALLSTIPWIDDDVVAALEMDKERLAKARGSSSAQSTSMASSSSAAAAALATSSSSAVGQPASEIDSSGGAKAKKQRLS